MESMERRFQFSTRNALIATAWAAVFLANAASIWRAPRSLNGLLFDSLGEFLLIAPPAAIVGALAGRPWLGFMCGAASAVMSVAWRLMMFYPY
jgi:hypothetical protein